MSDVAIGAENLSKRYRIGMREPYETLRDAVGRLVAMPFGAVVSAFSSGSFGASYNAEPYVWALKDVSFKIKEGEIVGIIGRNGAGKSTLLKILSRITEPTEGEARVYGRIGSLLEVGTGFHPELTGRENIYLNGALLGMRTKEIERKFDEIVAFSEVEKFIDTPVKRYSSGMYMRLAFAVAAHLDPDILLVDEVLAVGDTVFQKKCLGKMGEVANAGRTVLFVSHNMAAIERICERTITLDNGQVTYDGDTKGAIQAYVQCVQIPGQTWKIDVGEFELNDAPRGGRFNQSSGRAFQSLSIQDCNGRPRDVIACGEDVVFVIRYDIQAPVMSPTVGIIFSREPYGRLAFVQTRIQYGDINALPSRGELVCTVPHLPLAPGRYTLSLGISSAGQQLDWIEDQVELYVEPADFFGTGHLPPSTHGPLLLSAQWELPREQDDA